MALWCWRVAVPEPLHRLSCEPVAVGSERSIRLIVEIGIRHWGVACSVPFLYETLEYARARFSGMDASLTGSC